MLPKSYFILAAKVADKLGKAALAATGEGWREAGAVVHRKGRRLEKCVLIANRSERQGQMVWDRTQFSVALRKPPEGYQASVLFHSHPFSDVLSRADVESTPHGKMVLIFECATSDFLLFRLSRKAREKADRGRGLAALRAVSDQCRVPLYVETGIRALDTSIVCGAKHRDLVATVHREMKKVISEVILSSRWSAPPVSLSTLRYQSFRLSRLERFFEGLCFYFPELAETYGTGENRPMAGLSDCDRQYLVDAANTFLYLSAYGTSFEECKFEAQGGSDR